MSQSSPEGMRRQPHRRPERLQHVEGQRLTARDLQDDVLFEAGWRSLHVRAVHGVWGIALGYEVSLTRDRRGVRVAPGLAYDACGRELLQTAPRQLMPPIAPRQSRASAWWFDLLVRGGESTRPPALRWSYAADAPTAFVGTREFADDVRLGEDIPLVRIRMVAGGNITHVDRDLRRIARGLVRPHMAAGRLPASAVTVTGSVWDWTAWVDTSASSFDTEAPFYFARLADHPWLSPASGFAGLFSAPPLTNAEHGALLGPFVTIESVSKIGFAVHVRAAAAPQSALRDVPQRRGLVLPVPVDWVGIEPNVGSSAPDGNQA